MWEMLRRLFRRETRYTAYEWGTKMAGSGPFTISQHTFSAFEVEQDSAIPSE